MTGPLRIQRKRTKGWKMPQGKYVGRPTRWGNPYVVGKDGDAAECVAKYRVLWTRWLEEQSDALPRLKRLLGGQDLICWCALDKPCHADVLLELANS